MNYKKYFEGYIGDITCPMCKNKTTILDGLSDVSKRCLKNEERVKK